ALFVTIGVTTQPIERTEELSLWLTIVRRLHSFLNWFRDIVLTNWRRSTIEVNAFAVLRAGRNSLHWRWGSSPGAAACAISSRMPRLKLGAGTTSVLGRLNAPPWRE